MIESGIRPVRVLLFGCLFLWIAMSVFKPALAQGNAPDTNGLRVRIIHHEQPDNNHVRLQLSIIDAAGNTPGNLQRGSVIAQVSTLEDPLTAESVRAIPPDEQRPLTVVLVVDISDSMDPLMGVPNGIINTQLTGLVAGLERFPGARIGIVAFSDRVEQTLPITTEFPAAQNFVANLRTERIAADSNVMLEGVNAGIGLINDMDPNRDYALILVTDAVGTVITGPLSTAAQQMVDAGITFYSLSLPNLPLAQIADPAIPDFFAQETGGFAYMHVGELTANAVSASIASFVTNVLHVLQTRYEVMFNLRPLHNTGLSGELDFTVIAQVNGSYGSDSTTINYANTLYTPRFVGLEEGSLVTGTVPLEVEITPPLPGGTAYRYIFAVDETPLTCVTDIEPRCVWNTDTQTRPGHHLVQVIIAEGDIPIARAQVRVNVYHEGFTLDIPPSPLSGRVNFDVLTIAYADIANVLELYAGPQGQAGTLVEFATLTGDHTLLTWNVNETLDMLFPDEARDTAQVDLRFDIRNLTDNALIARRAIPGVTIVRAPEYTTSLVGLAAPAEPGKPTLVTGVQTITVQSNPTPPVDQGYELMLFLNDTLLANQAINLENTSLRYDWNTTIEAPGLYQLTGVLLQNGEQIGELDRRTINIYRDDLRPILPGRYEGLVDVTVPSAGLEASGENVELHVLVNGIPEPIIQQAGLTRGETTITWNVQEIFDGHPEIGDAANATLWVEVRNETNSYLLARSPQIPVTLFRAVTPVLQCDDLPPWLSNESPITFTCRVSPELIPGQGYELALVVGETIIHATTESAFSYSWNPAEVPPGRYEVALVLLRNGEPVTNAQPARQRIDIFQRLHSITFSPLQDDYIINGETEITVNTAGLPAPDVIILLLDTDGTGNFQEIARREVDRSSQTTYLWNVESLLNNSGQAEITALVRVDVRRVDDSVLARWEETRVLRHMYTPTLIIEGITRNQVVNGQMIVNVALDPPPPPDETVQYQFILNPGGTEVLIPLDQNTPDMPTLTWDFSSDLPGDYVLIIDVTLPNLRREPVREFIPFRLAGTAEVRGALVEQDTLRGSIPLEVNNYPDVARIEVQFRADGQTDFRQIAVGPVNARAITTTLDVDWQQIFSESDTEGSVYEGDVRVVLVDQFDQPLYQWIAHRRIVYNTDVGLEWLLLLTGILILLLSTTIWFYKRITPKAQRKLSGGETQLYTKESVLICSGPGLDIDMSVPLDRSVIRIGRRIKKVFPWQRQPDIAIADPSIHLRVGKIVREHGLLYLKVDKDVPLTDEPKLSTVRINGHPLKRCRQFNARERSVPLKDGDVIGLGPNDPDSEWTIELPER